MSPLLLFYTYKVIYCVIFIIFLGHFSSHLPHSVQSAKSMLATLSVTLIAPTPQVFSQILQPRQPEAHFCRVTAPLSWLEH